MMQSVSERHDLLDELAVEMANLRRLPHPEECRRIRQAAGASQHLTAEAAGVSVMAVSRWERGERTPRGETLARYLDVLDQLREMAG
jgi:DNA-binding transcriptional regulator YiaG